MPESNPRLAARAGEEDTLRTFASELGRIGAARNNIAVLTADLADSFGISGLARRMPGRFFNVGVAEQNMVGVAAGLATCGLKVFCCSYAPFLCLRAAEQIRTSVCLPDLDVVFCACHGGLSGGENGATHHGAEDFAVMRAFPGMKVIAPADSHELRAVMRAIPRLPGPIYLRLTRPRSLRIFSSYPSFKLGRPWRLLAGTDVTLVTTGTLLAEVLTVARQLKSAGISAGVVHVPTVKPIDAELIGAVTTPGSKLVICEEHSSVGGLANAVEIPLAGSRRGFDPAHRDPGPVFSLRPLERAARAGRA